jgi:hypothetical protein
MPGEGEEVDQELVDEIGKQFTPAVKKFAERQAKVIKAKKGAGAKDWWDKERWDRELTDDLVAVGMPPETAAFLAPGWNEAAYTGYAEEE